jgi:hypothetical protein
MAAVQRSGDRCVKQTHTAAAVAGDAVGRARTWDVEAVVGPDEDKAGECEHGPAQRRRGLAGAPTEQACQASIGVAVASSHDG